MFTFALLISSSFLPPTVIDDYGDNFWSYPSLSPQHGAPRLGLQPREGSMKPRWLQVRLCCAFSKCCVSAGSVLGLTSFVSQLFCGADTGIFKKLNVMPSVHSVSAVCLKKPKIFAQGNVLV